MAAITDERNTARQSVVDNLRRLLIGPLEPSEVIKDVPPGIDPSDFYLTGILWPADQLIGSDEDDENANERAEADAASDDGAPLFSIFKPSSIGITCSIEGANTPFEIVVDAARYKMAAGTVTDGQATVNWQRNPFTYRIAVAASERREVWRTSRFRDSSGQEVEDPHVMVHVRRRVRQNQLVVTATLINRQPRTDGERAGPYCLYQTTLSISTDPPNSIVPRASGLLSAGDEQRSGDLLFRNSHELAVGHAVGATWTGSGDGRAARVSTDWMPHQHVLGVTREGHKSLAFLHRDENSVLSAARLADTKTRKELVQELQLFAAAYESWIEERRTEVGALRDGMRDTAVGHLDQCAEASRRVRDGIELLAQNDNAFMAFALANGTMDEYFRSAVRPQPGPLRWAPFQLAFLLLTLRSVAEGHHPDRSVLDLLWFPTGGGKTEAYLGLVLFTIYHRRLTSKTAGDSGHVDVLMRYTLRLLTVQQFQRAASVISRAELLRQRRSDLGSSPISIGLFVGKDATPNRVLKGEQNAKEMLEAEADGKKPKSTPRLLLQCPLCNADLPVTAYQIDPSIPCVNIICPNSKCESRGEALPVHTVDEDLYRVRPSLVIGTVDKFAQLPRKEESGLLLGRPDGLPPELIIQDELHLISGPLGTMTGLYETVVDLLCIRNGILPKVIGSTATIGGAQRQVRALFDRGLMQFPPPGLDAADSFFAVRDEAGPDRLYVALSTSGRSPKYSLQAAAAALMQIVQAMRDQGVRDEVADPYWTLLLYFNSLRELGGAKVMMRDDVRRTAAFYASRLQAAVRPMELEEPLELTSRIPSSQIPLQLQQLNRGLGGDAFGDQPADSVLASNMISVGVDIPRLGEMLVNGQPKTTAEYIQATSRVGRGVPGLVLTVYNAARPRDVSHYEHFRHYHDTLYRRVEFMSVTPWSPRARDRALHAVLAAAVRHLDPTMADRLAAVNFRPSLEVIAQVVRFVRDRANRSGVPNVLGIQVEGELLTLIDAWAARAKLYRDSNGNFEYWARTNPFNNRPVNAHLMRGAEDPVTDEGVWRTPNSMREVEPQAYYVMWPEKGGK